MTQHLLNTLLWATLACLTLGSLMVGANAKRVNEYGEAIHIIHFIVGLILWIMGTVILLVIGTNVTV